MIIGTDFDGVIANDIVTRINFIKQKFGVVIGPDKLHGGELERAVGKDAKKQIEHEVNCSEKTLEFSPMPGVSAIFKRFVSDGDKIVIITGRTKQGVEWAKAFMSEHQIPYHHIWSAEEFLLRSEREQFRMLEGVDISLKKKAKFASVIKPAVFVEDSDAHLLNLLPLKDQITLYLFDQPYNKHFNVSGVQRVFSWEEVYARVQDMKRKMAA